MLISNGANVGSVSWRPYATPSGKKGEGITDFKWIFVLIMSLEKCILGNENKTNNPLKTGQRTGTHFPKEVKTNKNIRDAHITNHEEKSKPKLLTSRHTCRNGCQKDNKCQVLGRRQRRGDPGTVGEIVNWWSHWGKQSGVCLQD